MTAESTTPKLFNVLATDVTSSTRATWSEDDVKSFESFADEDHKLDGEHLHYPLPSCSDSGSARVLLFGGPSHCD